MTVFISHTLTLDTMDGRRTRVSKYSDGGVSLDTYTPGISRPTSPPPSPGVPSISRRSQTPPSWNATIFGAKVTATLGLSGWQIEVIGDVIVIGYQFAEVLQRNVHGVPPYVMDELREAAQKTRTPGYTADPSLIQFVDQLPGTQP
jgi:hypothetical protein